MHEPQTVLSPLEVADRIQQDLVCDSDRRINKGVHFIQRGRRLFAEKTVARGEKNSP